MKLIQRLNRTQTQSRRLIRLDGLTNHTLGVVQDALSCNIRTGLNKLNQYFTKLGGEVMRSGGKMFTGKFDTEQLELLDIALRSHHPVPEKLPQLVGCFFVLALDENNKPVPYDKGKRIYVLDMGSEYQRVLARFDFNELIPTLIAVCPDRQSPHGFLCVAMKDLMPGYTSTFIRSYITACGIMLTYSVEQ